MARGFVSIQEARWLTALSKRILGSRPIPLENKSMFRAPVSATLLTNEGLVLLIAGETNGESIRYREIGSARLIEDVGERYTVELLFADDRFPKATLFVRGSIFFFLFFATLVNNEVICDFGFTQQRLRALGAG